jgi:acyl-CoA reductase-like NAD-dependent aldehyde dehydrogenase
MTTALEPDLTTCRWSSNDPADRFPVEDPATGKVITLVQGGGTAEVDAAVEAAHRAFQTDWRWRPPAERAALLLEAAEVLAEHADELACLSRRVAPTLFTDVTREMRIATEEIFGPVATVTRFSDEDEAGTYNAVRSEASVPNDDEGYPAGDTEAVTGRRPDFGRLNRMLSS